MYNLPPAFVERMKKELGSSFGAFAKSYDEPPYKAIRVNTLKISVDDFIKISPFPLISPVPWERSGFYIAEGKAGKSPLHAAGLYYVQEPSAMSVAPLLRVERGERVLDLCSAPGGKGTQLAQGMCGEGVIVLNEINFPRAKILSQNVERLGVKNAVVTCATPENIAESFPHYFDKVLVDAPCSGEGMFKKEPDAIPEWSEENVAACAVRQRSILSCAAKVVRAGGLLAYSTCTFSRTEDEEQVAAFLSDHTDFSLVESKKLLPHECAGEGHFYALFRRSGEREEGETVRAFVPEIKDKKRLSLYRDFEKEYLKTTFDRLFTVGDVLYSAPCGMPKIGLQTLRAGVRLGEFKSGRFEPSHSLAACLKKEECVYSSELEEREAVSYLSGNQLSCPESLRGWTVVTYKGYPLGWVKCVSGAAKNHYPKGLRV